LNGSRFQILFGDVLRTATGGQTLAYTSDQAGAPQIYKVGINGGAPQRITWEGDPGTCPLTFERLPFPDPVWRRVAHRHWC
jgi:Tol biopolymer transport system component